MTSTTDASPAIAPMLIRYVSHASDGPAFSIATNTGCGTFSSVYCASPVITSAIRM